MDTGHMLVGDFFEDAERGGIGCGCSCFILFLLMTLCIALVAFLR